jgi:predicted RNA binding protein with dsRBD fold (UPF0201 family)
MEEENVFSLGDLDGSDYSENNQENEQEELYSEDATEIIEGSDNEESIEDEGESEQEFEEEIDETEEVGGDDDISYTPFVEPLIEEGLLWVDPEKEYDDSPEGFQEIIKDTVSHGIQEVVESLPEVLQQVFELSQLGEDPMTAFQTLNSFDYSQIDMEDESNQEVLVRDLYAEKFSNWSTEKLDRHIQNLKDLGELEEESKEAQEYFILKTEEEKESYVERVRLAREEEIARAQEEVDTYRQIIQESEGFAGISFTSNKQKSDFDRYCFEKGEDGLTQYERESKVPTDALTLAWYKFNNFGFEAVQKKARSEAYVEQKRILSRVADKNSKSNRTGTRAVERPAKKGFSLGDI